MISHPFRIILRRTSDENPPYQDRIKNNTHEAIIGRYSSVILTTYLTPQFPIMYSEKNFLYTPGHLFRRLYGIRLLGNPQSGGIPPDSPRNLRSGEFKGSFFGGWVGGSCGGILLMYRQGWARISGHMCMNTPAKIKTNKKNRPNRALMAINPRTGQQMNDPSFASSAFAYSLFESIAIPPDKSE